MEDLRSAVLGEIVAGADGPRLCPDAARNLGGLVERIRQSARVVEATHELLRLSYFLHVAKDRAGALALFELASGSLPMLERTGDRVANDHLRHVAQTLGLERPNPSFDRIDSGRSLLALRSGREDHDDEGCSGERRTSRRRRIL